VPKRIYFAHPVSVYNTPLEKELIELIQYLFAVEVENPNQLHHQKGYATFKEKYKNHPTKSGMTYFYEVVLPSCDSCVCQVYLDGKWGAGVAHEALFFLKKNLPIWIIDPNSKKIRSLSAEEKESITNNNPAIILSIEDTRLRTREGGKPDGKIIPYEQAHLI
jgi:hypothetical protein